MNWNILISLLLPIRLRVASLLIALLSSLTKYSRRMFDLDFAWVNALVHELRYTSQVKAMLMLLNDKFDLAERRIIISDETSGNVTLYSNDDLDYIVIASENTNICIARNEESCSVGLDFVVKVPLGVDKEAVRLYIKRYIFAGIGFKVINL